MKTRSDELQRFKAEFFGGLSHPLRIRILELLVGGERSVQELQQHLGVGQPLVSQQLAVLRARNVVVARKVGQTVRYVVKDPLLGDLLATARQMFNNHLAETRGMLEELRRERGRGAGAVRPAARRRRRR
jgi:ArsR family transcriptional regulator